MKYFFCKHNNNCLFRHNEQDLQMFNRVCKLHNKGICRKNVCKYQHPSEICKSAFCTSHQCDKKYPKTCMFYLNSGKCKYNLKCLFRHDVNERPDKKNNAMKRPLLVKNNEELISKHENMINSAVKNNSFFLSMKMKGQTRGVNILFDTGCSNALVKDCIPGIELKAKWVPGQQRILHGLGGSKMGETYRIVLPLIDGKHTVIEASSVDDITEPLEIKDALPAFETLKSEVPNNVQEVNIQSTSGGQIDILLGIKYINLFPKLVHQSKQGDLGLYKLKLLPNEKDKIFCLGGSYACPKKPRH